MKSTIAALFALSLIAQAQESYGKLPLQFEENHGQTDSRVKFLARGAGYTLFLTEREAVLALRRGSGPAANLRMVLEGATSQMTGSGALPGKVNYFHGNDSSRWKTGIATWQKVAYESIYPGIDLVFYGKQGQFEFDFVAAAGADPRGIRFRIEGAKASVDASGDVALTVADGETVTMKKPVVYQAGANGARTEVDGRFVVRSRNEIGFAVGKYDHKRPLVIDPTLLYASYLGGSQDDQILGLAVDKQGGAYVTGLSSSPNFPTTAGVLQAQQPTCAPGDCTSTTGPDAFVARISPDGTRLVYATYLGGNNEDAARAIAVDAAGNAYVTGYTFSNDFPLMNPYQSMCGPEGVFDFSGVFTAQAASCELHPPGEPLAYEANAPDVFITKLSPGGDQLLYSTYLGGNGNDNATRIGLDAAGNIYVAGSTSSTYSSSAPVYPNSVNVPFPTTGSGYQSATNTTTGQFFEAFLVVFSPDGQTLKYSSTFGGAPGTGQAEIGQGLGVGQNGFVALGGQATSPTMPTRNAIQSSCALVAGSTTSCVPTGFLAGFDTTKSGDASLVFATYLGGTTPAGAATDVTAVTVDANNNVFATGTSQARDFVYTAGSYLPHCSDTTSPGQFCPDSFVLKASATGALSWATSYGTGVEACPRVTSNAIALDQAGAVYFAGNTGGCGVPTVDAIPFTGTGGSNAFVAALSADGSRLVFGSMYGGSGVDTATAVGVDGSNNVYAAGTTNSSNLTTTTGAFETTYEGGAHDGFLLKISPLYVANATALSVDPNPTIPGATVNFTAEVAWSDGKPAPTGTVTFFDSTTALGSRAVGANGFAFYSTSSLGVGTHSVTASYSGDGNYGPSVSAPVSLVVKGSLTQTTTTAAAAVATYSSSAQNVTLSATVTSTSGPVTGGTVGFVVFGNTVSGAVTNGAASVSFPIPAGTIAGSYAIQATYTPGSGFAGSSDSAHSLVIGKATPTISWANPADIVSGTALSATQLNATASVAGSFVYTPGVGTVLQAGAAQLLSVAFTPSDGTDYAGANASVHINVNLPAATGTTTTAANAQATYSASGQNVTLSATVTASSGTVNSGSVGFTVLGSTMSGSVVNGAASVSFPIPAGKAAGTYPIQAVYTPGGNFAGSSDTTKSLTIAKAAPVITWANPADITSGTALGATQLNATASVPGSFVYNPASGAVLSQGSGQTLSVTFTPTDSTDYASANASVHINVTAPSAAATTTTAAAAQAVYSPATQNVTLSATVTSTAGTVNSGSMGFTVFGNTVSVVVANGAASVNFPIPAGKAAGTYPVQAVYTPSGNFTGNSDATKSLTIAKAAPVITWANPADITSGTALSATQLNATANVPGAFVYNPTSGALLSQGSGQTLSVMFTPTDSTDYAGANASVHINVTAPSVTSTTTTAVAAQAVYSPATQNVTLSATVTSTSGTVNSGSMGFTVFGNTVSVSVANGAASVSFPIPAGKAAGTYPIQATYTSAGNFAGSSDTTKSLTIGRANPVITWNPTPMYDATQVGASQPGPSQFNASASVPGSFAYSSTIGYILSPSPARTLTATFTPSDSVDYNTVPASATVTVLQRLQYFFQGVLVPSLDLLTLAFPPQIVGTTSAPLLITAVNLGPDDIPVSIPPPLFFDIFEFVNSCGTKYPAHSTCTISVTFAPLTLGPAEGDQDIIYPNSEDGIDPTGSGLPGNPSLKMTLLGTGKQSSVRYADVKVTNNGTGWSIQPQITQVTVGPSGVGATTLPLVFGDVFGRLEQGESATVRIFMSGTTGGVLLTLSGSMKDLVGATKTFSSTIVVPPQQ